MAAKNIAKTKVLVTGGSGYLGSWVVKMCLDRGYSVHTTVRSAEKAAFLMKIEGADERLKIFDGVDLLTAGAFDEPMVGCEIVMHTASPFHNEGGEDDLVKPAVEGTRTVLASCTKNGVKNVVLTSSVAAVWGMVEPKPEVYTSDTWSNEERMREAKLWYMLSKTVAERVAWEMSREEGCPWTLATINPPFITGPMLPGQPGLGTSLKMIIAFADGSMGEIRDEFFPTTDVRDVAEAHVLAAERDGAAGTRFLIIASSNHRAEVAEWVREALPEDLKKNVPTAVAKAETPPSKPKTDSSPAAKILGLKCHTAKQTTMDSVTTMLANGFSSTSQYQHTK